MTKQGEKIQRLKRAAAVLADREGVTVADVAARVGKMSEAEIAELLNKSTKAAAGETAVKAAPGKKATTTKAKKTAKKKRPEPAILSELPPGTIERVQADLQKVSGEIVTESDELPAAVLDLIDAVTDHYMRRDNIESMKAERQSVWKGLCMDIGPAVRKSGFIYDRNRPDAAGGFAYDVGKLASLAGYYLQLCARYNKAPFVDDAAHFLGVSDTWLYGAGARNELTPAKVALLKKLQAAQEAGLAGLIADGRQNPTGALAILNHYHGWTQTREIIHTTANADGAAAALPVFNTDAGRLVADNGGGA